MSCTSSADPEGNRVELWQPAMEASLCIVEPGEVRFEVTAENKARVTFTHRGRARDLPLTDFRIANVMRAAAPGDYSLDDL